MKPLLPLLLVLAFGAAARAEWPMHRGGPQLQGRTTMPAPPKAEALWTVKLPKPIKAGAAIAGRRVVVGDDAGIVHALDLATGHELWTFKTDGPIEATPLILEGVVYLGSSDGLLYALSAADGTLRWKYQTDDKIMGGANHVKKPDGTGEWIIVGSYDANLHCVDAATGQGVWKAETDNYINGSPALTASGLVLFGGCDAIIHVVNLADGKPVRQIECDAYIASSVAVLGTMGYVGNYANVVIGFDTADGTQKWKYRDRNFPYFSSAAVTEERVVIGGRDKRLHCLDRAKGESVWNFQTRGQVDSSPVICGDAVVVGSMDGRLYCVGLADGRERWTYELGAAVSASPAASDGVVVIGAEDGTMVALGSLTAP